VGLFFGKTKAVTRIPMRSDVFHLKLRILLVAFSSGEVKKNRGKLRNQTLIVGKLPGKPVHV
jgi:hypothetical protein